MATCNKNFPVNLDNDGTKTLINATSVQFSEQLNLQTAKSIGIKGSKAVFNTDIPKGSATINGYLDDGVDASTSLATTNNNNVGVSAGPYSLPTPCTLTSMSIEVTPGEVITSSRTFNYYGALSTPASPTPGVSEPREVALPGNLELEGYTEIGGTGITSATWKLDQQYEEVEVMGKDKPLVVFQGGTITLTIAGDNLTEALTNDTSKEAACIKTPKDYTVTINNCSGESMGTLEIEDGYMQGRGSAASIGDTESPSVTIIQYL